MSPSRKQSKASLPRAPSSANALRRSRPSSPERLKALVYADEVLRRLQELGFAIGLCGHEHIGFVRQVSAINTNLAPIHVFSVGTATQELGPNPSAPNEYRFYDFAADQDDICAVTIHSFTLRNTGSLRKFEPDANGPIVVQLDATDYR